MTDADHSDLYIDEAREQHKLNPPAIVHVISLDDETISPTLRGITLSPQEAIRYMQGLLKNEDPQNPPANDPETNPQPGGQEAPAAAPELSIESLEREIIEQLKEFTQHIEGEWEREYKRKRFDNYEGFQNFYYDILKAVPADTRSAFLWSLYQKGEEHPELSEALGKHLRGALYFIGAGYRADFLIELFQRDSSQRARSLLIDLLDRSTGDQFAALGSRFDKLTLDAKKYFLDFLYDKASYKYAWGRTPELMKYVDYHLDKLGPKTSHEEKVALIQHFLEKDNKKVAAKFFLPFISQTKTYAELSAVIDAVGYDALKEFSQAEPVRGATLAKYLIRSRWNSALQETLGSIRTDSVREKYEQLQTKAHTSDEIDKALTSISTEGRIEFTKTVNALIRDFPELTASISDRFDSACKFLSTSKRRSLCESIVSNDLSPALIGPLLVHEKSLADLSQQIETLGMQHLQEMVSEHPDESIILERALFRAEWGERLLERTQRLPRERDQKKYKRYFDKNSVNSNSLLGALEEVTTEDRISFISWMILRGEGQSENLQAYILSGLDNALKYSTPEERALFYKAAFEFEDQEWNARVALAVLDRTASLQEAVSLIHEVGLSDTLSRADAVAKRGDDYLPGVLLKRAATEAAMTKTLEKLLRELPESRERDALLERYEHEEIRFAEFAEGFLLLTPERRADYLRALIVEGRTNPRIREFADEKIDNLLRYTSLEERAALVKDLLAREDKNYANQIIEMTLRASRDRAELATLIESVGVNLLLETEHDSIVALVGHVELYKLLSTRALPQALDATATSEASTQAYENLRAVLQQMIQDIEASPFKDTQAGKDLVHAFNDDLIGIATDLISYAEKPEELLKQFNVYLVSIDLEREFNVNVTWEHPENVERIPDSGSSAPRWTLQDIKDLRDVIERIPEGVILFTPLLRELKIVAWQGQGVLGARYTRDGKIHIASWTRDAHEWAEENFPGWRPLQIVMAHEIGHGVQIGASPHGVIKEESNPDPEAEAARRAQREYEMELHKHEDDSEHDHVGCIEPLKPEWADRESMEAFLRQIERVGLGELRYSFREFMNLSSWHLVDRDRYSVRRKEGSEERLIFQEYIITFDGKEYESGDTVTIDGKKWTIKYSGGWEVLWAFDEDSDFSPRWYSKASPWEDFAEAFAYYLYMPEVLIQHAPEKFLHLEMEFERYRDEDAIMRSAQRRAASRRKHD